MHFIQLYFMRRLDRHRIFVESCDSARRILQRCRIKCDASKKISLYVAFPLNKIARIKCDETSTSKPGLSVFYLAHFTNSTPGCNYFGYIWNGNCIFTYSDGQIQ